MLCWQTSRTALAATAALPKDGVHPPARRSRRTLRSRSWAQAGTPAPPARSPSHSRPRIRLPTSFTSCLLAHLAHSRCIHPSPLSSSFPFPTHAIAEGRCQQFYTRKLMSMGQPKSLISSQGESKARPRLVKMRVLQANDIPIVESQIIIISKKGLRCD